MKVLIGCEVSGTIRRAFQNRGHDAWSCDLQPASDQVDGEVLQHYICDVERAISFGDWDIIIVHPPCTAIAVSGNAHYSPGKHLHHLRLQALAWTERLWELVKSNARIGACLENPVSVLARIIGPSTQIVQPNQFGHDASKATCLWLDLLPKLKANPAKRFSGRIVEHKGKIVERWSNQTDSGQNKLAPSPTRAAERAVTYQSGRARRHLPGYCGRHGGAMGIAFVSLGN